MVLLLDHFGATHVFAWVHNPPLEAAEDVLLLTVFGWLALRGGRWWPLFVAASFVLMGMVHLLSGLSAMSRYDALSARLGLWILIYVTVLAGIGERWLAGEEPVGAGVPWRRRVSPAP